MAKEIKAITAKRKAKITVPVNNRVSKRRVKLPQIKERRIERPSIEQLELLEKAMYHSYKMMFEVDNGNNPTLMYDGIPIMLREGGPVDLQELFKKIVNVYATL